MNIFFTHKEDSMVLLSNLSIQSALLSSIKAHNIVANDLFLSFDTEDEIASYLNGEVTIKMDDLYNDLRIFSWEYVTKSFVNIKTGRLVSKDKLLIKICNSENADIIFKLTENKLSIDSLSWNKDKSLFCALTTNTEKVEKISSFSLFNGITNPKLFYSSLHSFKDKLEQDGLLDYWYKQSVKFHCDDETTVTFNEFDLVETAFTMFDWDFVVNVCKKANITYWDGPITKDGLMDIMVDLVFSQLRQVGLAIITNDRVKENYVYQRGRFKSTCRVYKILPNDGSDGLPLEGIDTFYFEYEDKKYYMTLDIDFVIDSVEL